MKFSFYTLGCKVNQYETNSLKEVVLKKGHELSDVAPDAFIINTCTVTAVSDKKNIKLIRKVKKDNPNAIIAVCGCFAQISPEKANMPEVDIVCGTSSRLDVIDMCIDSFNNHNKHLLVSDNANPTSFEIMPVATHSTRTRGLLKIQDGCNNFCSYCIIPYARGRSRSMPFDEVISQCQELSNTGLLEIVITGIEIASYGHDISENFIDLLDTLCKKFPHIRFRLGSLEPRIITEDFCKVLSKNNNLNPHFHLSLQSGCDTVLKRMNRKYDTELFYDVCLLLRKYFDNPSITTDLIVGFPGETDKEFNTTLDFIRKCEFSSMHVFPYSIREGTKASNMENQINQSLKSQRAKQASLIASEMEDNFLSMFVGRVLDVILEEPKNDFISGHTSHHFSIATKTGDLKQGQKVSLRIVSCEKQTIFGEIIN